MDREALTNDKLIMLLEKLSKLHAARLVSDDEFQKLKNDLLATADSRSITSQIENYLRRHNRGELSLGVSFWVNYTVLPILFSVLFFLLLYFLTEIVMMFAMKGYLPSVTQEHLDSFVELSTVLFTAAFNFLFSKGVWLSANNRIAKNGGRFWASVAKGVVLFYILFVIHQTVLFLLNPSLPNVLYGTITGTTENWSTDKYSEIKSLKTLLWFVLVAVVFILLR